MLPINAVMAAQQLVLPCLASARVVLDATAGNGKDTLFLARHTPPEAIVWSFDIQPTAIENTRKLLNDAGLLAKVRLILDSHDRINTYINQPLDAAMFNLGYLPSGERTIVTQPKTTISAVDQTANLLNPGALMTIVAYPGHCSGKEENQALMCLLAALPQQVYSVLSWKMLNQVNNPPLLYAVEKRRKLTR